MDKKILIVDDDRTTLFLLEKNLLKEGYQVATAGNGQEAIDQIKKVSPDFIVMDILLPDIPGPDVVKALQEDSAAKDIPVIFLSEMIEKQEGGDGPDDVKVGDRYYHAIGKPPSWEAILNEIESALK